MKNLSRKTIIALLTLSMCSFFSVATVWSGESGSGDSGWSEYALKFSYGKSTDDLSFDIGGTTYGVANLSTHDEWSDVVMRKGTLVLDGRFYDDVLPRIIALRLQLSGSYGQVDSGNASESGADPSLPSPAFSHITADINSGNTWDVSTGIGVEVSLFDTWLRVTPMLGFARYSQTFNKVNGVETLDPYGWSAWPDYYPVGAIADLDSEFSADWRSPWRGVEIMINPASWISVHLAYRDFWAADYSGKAISWDVRNSHLTESRSFVQDASGDGYAVQLDAILRLGKHMAVVLGYQLTSMDVSGGNHKANMVADGSQRVVSLSGAEWSSQTVHAGLELRY